MRHSPSGTGQRSTQCAESVHVSVIRRPLQVTIGVDTRKKFSLLISVFNPYLARSENTDSTGILGFVSRGRVRVSMAGSPHHVDELETFGAKVFVQLVNQIVGSLLDRRSIRRCGW